MILSDGAPVLIDPREGPVNIESMRSLLKAFAVNPVYRSAAVEELLLNHDFFRRPLRPEDLTSIDFSTLIDGSRTSSLSALMTHRLLLCINESQHIRLPARSDAAAWTAFREFYSERNRALGAAVRPFLEYHAFHFLEDEQEAGSADLDSLVDAAFQVRASRLAAHEQLAGITARAPESEATRRMHLLQFFGLAETKQAALSGAPDTWLADFPACGAAWNALLQQITKAPGAGEQETGRTIARHGYWQFYLPASIAAANLLYYLNHRGPNIFRSLGALLFTWVNVNAPEHAASANRLRGIVNTLISPLAEHFGPRVWTEAAIGFKISAAAEEIADQELVSQLSWISSLDRHRDLANRIQQKIDEERIVIDRETFVEPREMCSTTHVHDDFRLVVIESGEMVFWAMPGMRLCLKPGEKILVPRHRLHGSSVLSDVCVYHQPIIPEDWIARYTAGAANSVWG
jgi:hypothetical protein